MNNLNRFAVLFSLSVLLLSSCSKLGYGVLLWSIDEPPVDSGSVLPVYIRSNIEKIWVVGVPETVKSDRDVKIEIPLTQLEFFNSKNQAVKRAQEFAPYAMTYAENLQDGLPIRASPENNSQRVYRLRLGEIVKIMAVANGSPPISATGDPLPGDWYKVLTNAGVTGYCFSYRLKLFNQNEESLASPSASTSTQRERTNDPDLDMLLSKTWSSESYLQMVNSRRINLKEMEKKYRFDPGAETGVARIILPNIERDFSYQRISSDGERSWLFEGANLQMTLRTNTSLAVQFIDSGSRRTLIFVSLSTSVEDMILQENARRETQFLTIYERGPAFTSNNYGTIKLLRSGDFIWTGYEALVPQVIPNGTRGSGRITMDIYISPSYEDRYNGAFTLQFSDIRANNTLYFMYGFDSQGLRLEVVPDYGIEDITVMRRASSPVILYFFRDTSQL
ncbi:MAG: SH3 domain-containing protein [Treponema sp.]|nr:SH3 domain-containing protein [Treponema sp.]